MLRTMRRRNAFAVTRTSTRSPRLRRPAARRGAGPSGRARRLPRAAKSRSPSIRAAAARMAVDVEPVVDLERPMPFERPRRPVHQDPVAIHAPARVAPRIEAPRRSAGASARPGPAAGAAFSRRRSSGSPPGRGELPWKAECHDLAGGMHPGIGSPGEADSRPLADQPVKRLLQLPLHGPSVRLDLRAGEGRPVVLDHRPCASLRVGGHRSVSVFCWLVRRSDELDLDHRRRVARSLPDLHDAG